MNIKRCFWFIFSIALGISLVLGSIRPSLGINATSKAEINNTFHKIERQNYLLAETHTGEFSLPPLPYSYDALDRYIDSQTMSVHHDKHHAGYVKNLNAAIAKHPELKGQSVEQLLRNINRIPEDIRSTVRNNGGGHANHTMFWAIMTPNDRGQLNSEISQAIEQTFGSVENFQQEFNNAGKMQFGSGWVWLVLNSKGQLEITTTANQDSPLIKGQYPILGNDVWEHAYYLKYQNNRGEYLNNWWNVINWNEINRRFELAKAFIYVL